MTEQFVLWLTVPSSPQPSEPAYRERNFVSEKYAPPKPAYGVGRVLGEVATAGLYSLNFGAAQAAVPHRRQAG